MTFDFRENIEKMTGYVPGYQPTDPAAIKINTNENPYPPSPEVLQVLTRLGGEDLRRYPKVLWDDFRTVAARLHQVQPDMIVCGNGMDELLSMLVRCCCDSLRPLAYPVPTYTLYPVLARIQNCPVIEIPWQDDYRIPTQLYHTGASLTIICNPNAPTGTFLPIGALAELAGKIDGVLAIDEAYVDFADDNALRLLHEYDNVVVLRSMSKGYSLAGLRLGYAIAHSRIVESLLKVKDSYNVNVVTQAAGAAALQDQEYFRENVRKIISERERLTKTLRELNFQVGDSQTNFLLVRPPAGISAEEIYQKLTRRNIYIRYFKSAGLQDKVRITVGTVRQNDALLDALKQILTEPV